MAKRISPAAGPAPHTMKRTRDNALVQWSADGAFNAYAEEES